MHTCFRAKPPAQPEKYIFINTYSGQELDDVAKASCELFDPKTNVSIAKYKLTSSHQLDKHTALVMGCIYRDSSTNEWFLRIISEAAHGRVASELVDELQNFLVRNPPLPPNIPMMPETITCEMPQNIPMTQVPNTMGWTGAN